jgi:hypothetical protein
MVIFLKATCVFKHLLVLKFLLVQRIWKAASAVKKDSRKPVVTILKVHMHEIL